MHVKVERICSELQKQISNIINYDIKDPRLTDCGMISVMRVEAYKDLDLAKVYVSFFNGKIESKEGIKLLQTMENFIKKQLYKNMKIRKVPKLLFLLDQSVEYSYKIEKIINQIQNDSAK